MSKRTPSEEAKRMRLEILITLRKDEAQAGTDLGKAIDSMCRLTTERDVIAPLGGIYNDTIVFAATLARSLRDLGWVDDTDGMSTCTVAQGQARMKRPVPGTYSEKTGKRLKNPKKVTPQMELYPTVEIIASNLMGPFVEVSVR